MKYCFFRKKSITAGAVFFVVLFLFIARINSLQATVYDFVQTDWSGGADTGLEATHSNQSGWASFYSKNATLNASVSGQVSLPAGTSTSTSESVMDTSSTDFSSASTTNVVISGTGDSAVVKLTERKMTQLKAGYFGTCAIYEGGIAKCWGEDYTYGYGGGTDTHRKVPTVISFSSTVVDISSDQGYGSLYEYGDHICAVLSNGKIECLGKGRFGNNDSYVSFGETRDYRYGANGEDYANLADSISTAPIEMTNISTATQVSSTFFNSCAVLSNGKINCWGMNDTGQLGAGYANTSPERVATSTEVLGIDTAVQVDVGYNHVCAVLSDGTVRCWGKGTSGQLGNSASLSSSSPVQVTGITNATKVMNASYTSCALLDTGEVKCWGYNLYGQLGNGSVTTTTVTSPVSVTGITTAVDIDLGDNAACAALADGTVQCWGNKTVIGLSGTNLSPVEVSGLSNVQTVDVGNSHSCFLLNDGSGKCMGNNIYGSLGNNEFYMEMTPTLVTGLSNVAKIDNTGTASSFCALLNDGTAKCWGLNTYGLLGTGDSGTKTTPTDHVLSNMTDITLGSYHGCAIISGGTVQCWGENGYGQLGNGSNTDSLTPVSVTGITNATSIKSLGFFTCVLTSDATVKCWGFGTSGQLGNAQEQSSNIPVDVTDITNASRIAVGSSHACARLTDGTARCWGANSNGQLGDGTFVASSSPVVVSGLTGVYDIDAGNSHTCAHINSGTVKCWGNGTDGQRGDGWDRNPAEWDESWNVPSDVTGVSSVSSIDLNGSNSCVVLSSGEGRCWGTNKYGGLGSGDSTTKYNATSVVNISTFTQIVTGANTSCGIVTGGNVYCWGYMDYLGQDYSSIETTHSTPQDIYSDQYTLSSGIVDSQVFDTTYNENFGSIIFNTNTPTNTSISVKVRTGTSSDMVSAANWSTCTAVSSAADISANSCVNDGNRYVQYQATLDSTSYTVTPQFEDARINHSQGAVYDLVFSPYDTGNSGNYMQDIAWTESVDNKIKFQIRTAADSGGSPGTWSSWYGTVGVDDYYSTASTNNIHTDQEDASSDQWMQVRAIFEPSATEDVILTVATTSYGWCDTITAASSYNPFPTCGALSCDDHHSVSGVGASATCVCTDILGVATYNAIGTCGAASCASAHTLSGSGGDATCICSTITGALTYNALGTCGAATCADKHEVSGTGSDATCVCESIAGAATYNAVGTCGAATCSDAHTLTGSGADATCECTTITGALTYNAVGTCGAATCVDKHEVSGTGSDATCVCESIAGAATYNAVGTCGAATCSDAHTLTGSGADATCACTEIPGAATYNALGTCGAATCSAGHTLSGSGADATCQCTTITGAASYNALGTCGAASCQSGYTLSGSGSSATCTVQQSSGGGGGGGGGVRDTKAPDQPDDFTAVYDGSNISLSWSNPINYDFFRVVLGRSSVPFADDLEGLDLKDDEYVLYFGKNEEYEDEDVVVDNIYYYALSAYDSYQNYSDPLILKMGTSTDEAEVIEEEEQNQDQNQEEQHEEEEEKIEDEYDSLYGLPGNIVDVIAEKEAKEICGCSNPVTMGEAEKSVYDRLISEDDLTIFTNGEQYKIAYFIQHGTKTTRSLGGGERGGAFNSFKSAFGKFPENWNDWSDVIKIGNGRWPSQENEEAIEKAKLTFKKIYLRDADMNQPNDNAAVTVMAYGLRPVNRNFDSEKAAILSFEYIFKYHPSSASDWDAVRAIAYSGATR